MFLRNIKVIVKLKKYCCGMLLRWQLELPLSNIPKPKKKSRSQRKECLLEKDIAAIERELDQEHLPEADKDIPSCSIKNKTTRNGRNNPLQNSRGHFKI